MKVMRMAYFAPYIDETGIHMPSYEERLEDLISAYRGIFGVESEMGPEVPDYQLLSVFAKALDDTSALVVDTFNSRNPFYARGAGLDLLLPQFGLTRISGESDAAARTRIRGSLAGRGTSMEDALEAALRALPNVQQVLIRVNDTNSTVDGIPAHSIACIVNNGNAQKIAETIFAKKTPGISTHGSVSRTVVDEYGESHMVKFSRPANTVCFVAVTLKAYAGFDQAVVTGAMTEALMNYINYGMEIGESLNVPQLYGRLYAAAGGLANTFAITDLAVTVGGTTYRDRVDVAWNGKLVLFDASSVSYTVV